MESALKTDLRRVGLHPDFWQPLLRSSDVPRGGMKACSFAGEPINVARTASGELFALHDRCAHRQVPLSAGVLCGDRIRCGYHGWSFDRTGRCTSAPARVASYRVREAHGLIWVFPGDQSKADAAPFPEAPAYRDPAYKTRTLSRRIRCHYSFMHENLMDMNHQFLHRSLMGSITPVLLRHARGADWVEAVYRFERTSGRQSLGEKFMIGPRAEAPTVREHDVMTIRTQYPYQTLTFHRADKRKPALDLWLAYVPVDAEQKWNHSYGLMSIERPAVPGLIHLFWPFICLFTDGIFRQDQWVVEEEQKAWDEQGGDRNNELFPLINDVRAVLAENGVPIASPDRASAV